MKWIEGVRQAAVIDEAEQLATRYLMPEFADVRALYAAIGFDATAFATELLALANGARDARAASAAAQARYEVDSGESRDVVAEVRAWLEELRYAARYAKEMGHPLGEGLDRLFASSDLEAGSWSQAIHAAKHALSNLRLTAALPGMPPDFVSRGEALVVELGAGRADTHVPWKTRIDQANLFPGPAQPDRDPVRARGRRPGLRDAAHQEEHPGPRAHLRARGRGLERLAGADAPLNPAGRHALRGQSRGWLEYAREAGKDLTLPAQHCGSAAGTGDFCRVE